MMEDVITQVVETAYRRERALARWLNAKEAIMGLPDRRELTDLMVSEGMELHQVEDSLSNLVSCHRSSGAAVALGWCCT